MATIDVKEIQDAVEDGIKVLKSDWEKVRQSDQKKFDDRVEEVLKTLETASTKDDVQNALKDVQEDMQKQFNELAVKVNEEGLKGKKTAKSFKQAFNESMEENFEQLKKSLEQKSAFTFDMKDFDWPNFDGSQPYNTDFRTNMYGLKDDPFHWRNIIPNGSTSKGFIEYPKELEDDGAPGPWSDTAPRQRKPEFNPNIEVASNKVEWIAGIIPNIPVSILEDLSWAQSFLNRRAYRALLRAEDTQLLNGNGTSPQLSGLLQNSVAYNGSFTNPVEVIVDAAERQIADNENDATDVVISNTDKVSIILNKAVSSGVYNLPAGAVGYVNGQLTFAGLRLHSTRQFTAGNGIIGDFREAEFVIRSAPRLRWFDQNEDDATRNVLLLRIEERGVLAVYDENAFVQLSFS